MRICPAGMSVSKRTESRPAGYRSVRGDQGFTLIELMLVLLVMAVVSGLVALSVGRSPVSSDQARVRVALPAFVQSVSDHARLHGRAQALQWESDALVHYEPEGRLPGSNETLARHDAWSLPESWTLQLEVDQQPVAPARSGPPLAVSAVALQVMPDGTFSRPWRVRFRDASGRTVAGWLVSDGVNPPYWEE